MKTQREKERRRLLSDEMDIETVEREVFLLGEREGGAIDTGLTPRYRQYKWV